MTEPKQTWAEFVQEHAAELKLPPRGPRGSLDNLRRIGLAAEHMHRLGELWRQQKETSS